MGLGLSRKLSTGGIPVWQGLNKDIQLAQGGFFFDMTGLVAGVLIPAGTPMIFSEATRYAKPVATAQLYADATNVATTYQIKKGSIYKVGDYFSAVIGGKAYAITAIDTSNANYDVVTVGTTLGVALLANALTFASSATGAAAGALPAINGLLYEDLRVDANGGQSCSIVIRGTVYARRVPYSAAIEAALPRIIYSQSF